MPEFTVDQLREIAGRKKQQEVAPGTKVSALGFSPNALTSYNKDFPREAPPEVAPWNPLTAPTKTWGPRIMQALALPHEKISKPASEWLHPKLPEILQGSKNVPVEKRQEILAQLIDFPVYGGVDKLVRGIVGGAKALMGAKPVVSPTGTPTALSNGIDLEERMAAAVSVGGSPELGVEAATAAKPMNTPYFLQPPTTPWVAGMTHPRLKGMTEGGYVQRSSVPGRTNPPETFPRPRVVPGINPTQYEFETARMGRPGFAPPSKMQPELPAQPLPVPMAPMAPEAPWYSRGVLEDAIKAERDAKKTKALLNDIKGMKGMGNDEEVSQLLEMLGKLGGG